MSLEAQRIPRWASAVAFWRSSALRGRPYRVATAVAECRACICAEKPERAGGLARLEQPPIPMSSRCLCGILCRSSLIKQQGGHIVGLEPDFLLVKRDRK